MPQLKKQARRATLGVDLSQEKNIGPKIFLVHPKNVGWVDYTYTNAHSDHNPQSREWQ